MSDRSRPLAVGAIACLSVAVILLALVSLSTPLIRTISFVEASGRQSVLNVASASVSLSIGMWGVCISTSATASSCSKPALGFRDLNLGSLPGASKLAEILATPAADLLVLHPIALLFAVIALPTLIFARHRPWGSRFAVIASALAAVSSTLAMLVDLGLASAARLAISLITPLGTSFGAAFWLQLVALVFIGGATYLQARLRRATATTAAPTGWVEKGGV